jgi:hypothetical protein
MIRNKYELRQEKKRLRDKEKELKGKISYSWKELKNSIRPKNLIASQLDNQGIPHDDKDSILVNIFSYSAALLGRKLGERAEEKLGDMFRKEE